MFPEESPTDYHDRGLGPPQKYSAATNIPAKRVKVTTIRSFVPDDRQTHKVSGVVEAVQARDARVLYLPPYSPDFNPIERVFSKSKNELRRRELRTIDARENAFGESLDWITKTDALRYFHHSGYAKQ